MHQLFESNESLPVATSSGGTSTLKPPNTSLRPSPVTSRRPSGSKSPLSRPLRILVAPSGFKEAIGPEAVADCIEAGLRRIYNKEDGIIQKLPLHDGGEGFCQALVFARGGEMHELTVTGPTGRPVESHFGLIENRETAVLDMAAAAGLRLVPKSLRDPTITTTYGVGELIRAALDTGCRKIIIGCGDSGTSDGGAGMLQALGAEFKQVDDTLIPKASGGAALANLKKISLDNLHPRLKDVEIQAVCNIKNVLCGDQGVARVYGPQKGASKEQVEMLSLALEKLAAAVHPIVGEDIATKPGSGASGGLGAAIMLLGGQLRARNEAINEYFGIHEILDQHWDFVFTAEGSLDFQSSKGKMTVEIARRARQAGAQVVALAGTIGDGADTVYDEGIEAFTSILNGPLSLEDAIRETEKLLKDAAERTMRMIQMGMALREGAPAFTVLENESFETFPPVSQTQQGPVPSLVKIARAMTS